MTEQINEFLVGALMCSASGILLYFMYYLGTFKYKDYYERYYICKGQMDRKHKEVSALRGKLDVMKGRLDEAYKIINKTAEYDKKSRRFKKRTTFWEV